MSEHSRIIQLWKENNIKEAIFTFDCGGDNMGDTEWAFYNPKGEQVNNAELEKYFDRQVYNKVEFYVNSDGHYQGENGTVTVTLEETGVEEPYFQYSKCAESEYSESHIENIEVLLTPEEAEFVRKYVENMNGGIHAMFQLNFKVDCLLSDEEEEILIGLNKSIGTFVEKAEPQANVEGELDDWYSYTTDLNQGDNIPQFKDGEPNTLLVEKNFSSTVYKSDNS